MKKNKYSNLVNSGYPTNKKSVSQLVKGIKLLKRRLKHQQEEVLEAQEKWQKPGYGKRYFYRMCANRDFTKRQLQGYKDALKRR